MVPALNITLILFDEKYSTMNCHALHSAALITNRSGDVLLTLACSPQATRRRRTGLNPNESDDGTYGT